MLEVVRSKSTLWESHFAALGVAMEVADVWHEPYRRVVWEKEQIGSFGVTPVGWVLHYELGSGVDSGAQDGAGSSD